MKPASLLQHKMLVNVADGVIRDWFEPTAGQAMCDVPRKQKLPEHERLREALSAQQDFEPFRLAEAYDQPRRLRHRISVIAPRAPAVVDGDRHRRPFGQN
jgi:hypothetical protein